MTSLRVFFIGGLISYRACFHWLRPSIYIPTMLGSPVFQILFFAYLGRYSGLRNDAFFVIGNSVQICAMASIYGTTMTIGNERFFGTLSSLLASPANRAALFLGRAVPLVANGLLVSIFGFATGLLLLDFVLPARALPALALILLVSVFSCTSLGLLVGSIGLRARDIFFISNLIYFLMLLFCGVNVPLQRLPEWMQGVGLALPLTRGIEAARNVAAGGELSDVMAPLLGELLVGVAYAGVAYSLFRLIETEARRRGALDRY